MLGRLREGGGARRVAGAREGVLSYAREGVPRFTRDGGALGVARGVPYER